MAHYHDGILSYSDEHKVGIEEIYKRVGSSANGLSSEEAKKRLAEQGPNVLETKRKHVLLFKFLGQFKNFFAMLLIIAGLLAFFADKVSPGNGYNYIGIALIAVAVLNAIFVFIQQYESEKIMDSFKKMMPDEVDVLRDGEKTRVSAKEIVVGDVIFISTGDKIPADARLILQNSLKVDHAPLTGESEPQLRNLECTHQNLLESRNMIFSGTLVLAGDGKAIVYATGMNTHIGKIVRLTHETKSVETPLHKEIRHFSKVIFIVALILGVAFFIASAATGLPLIGSLIFAIGIIVANVPEGLLPTVTLCLSMAARRMAKKNALIKNLESVETLGSTTVICTDKTGTITEGKMEVNTIFLDSEELNVYEKGIHCKKGMQQLLRTMVLCNNSVYSHAANNFLGDPNDTSLMKFASRSIDVPHLLHLINSCKRVHESPFDSKTKRMITTNLENNQKIVHMKGAPEVVLNASSKILFNGRIATLSRKHCQEIMRHYEKIASRGEHVLAFAYKELEHKETRNDKKTKTEQEQAEESGFVFLGLAGLMDPPRKEIPEAVQKCRTAGIRIIMITGDYSTTAEAVSRKTGIIPRGQTATVIKGDELDKMSNEQLSLELDKENILFARTNPLQKLRIVKALQEKGEIVTVTGDGVNDAPALKHADMGVAMGASGTEVAREASDMVLMDDNFATIVSAVEEGRTVFDNIKKFISYILISNVPEILPFIAMVLLSIPLPLSVVLILTIDLGTDMLPAIGLGAEKPESDVMKEPPRKKNERLLTPQLLFASYGIVGMIEAAAGFFAYFFVLFNGGWNWGQQLAINDPLYLRAVTAFFASIIICQAANVLAHRTKSQSVFKHGLFANRVVIAGILLELLILSIIVYLPSAQTFFGTATLTIWELMLALPFALVIFFGAEIQKFLSRKGLEKSVGK